MEPLLTLKDLSGLLQMKENSIRTLLWQIRRGFADPSRLPPKMTFVGGNPRWSQVEVYDWLERHGARNSQSKHKQAAKAGAKHGRPRKTAVGPISLY